MTVNVALDPNNTAAQNKAQLVSALNSFNYRGGEIRLPRSDVPFLCEPGIAWPARRNLELVGDGAANAYEDGFGGTQLRFTTGSVGIDCSQINVNDPASPYAHICNISFHGDCLCAEGLRLGGIMQVSHVEAKNFTQANIHALRLVNSLVLNHVSTIGGQNLGLLIGSDTATNPNNTRIIVNELISRANLVGVRIEQIQGARFNGGVIESNYNNGMVFYRAANRVLEDVVVRDMHFESNGRTESGIYYAIAFLAESPAARPTRIRVRDSIISAGSDNKSINADAVDDCLFEDLIVYGESGATAGGNAAIDLGQNASNVGFLGSAPLISWLQSLTTNQGGASNWFQTRGPASGSTSNTPCNCDEIAVLSTLSDANATLTAAQMIDGIIAIYPTASRTITTATAAAIITAMGGYVQNKHKDIVIMNRAAATGTLVTVAAGAGVTVVGQNVIDVGSGQWRIVMTSSTTVSLNNISAK